MKIHKLIQSAALTFSGLSALGVSAQTTYNWGGSVNNVWDATTANWAQGTYVNSVAGTPTRAAFSGDNDIAITAGGVAAQQINVTGTLTLGGGPLKITMSNGDAGAGTTSVNVNADSTLNLNSYYQYSGTGGYPFSTHLFNIGANATLNVSGGGIFSRPDGGTAQQWNITAGAGAVANILSGNYTGISSFQAASGIINIGAAMVSGNLQIGASGNTVVSFTNADSVMNSGEHIIGTGAGSVGARRSAVLNIASGSLTATWHINVGNAAAYTDAEMNVSGGYVRVNGNTGGNGLHMFARAGGAANQTAQLNISGGTVITSFIDFGGWSDTDAGVAANVSSTATLRLTGGQLYLGLSNNNVKEGLYLGKLDADAAKIELGGGTLAAMDNWSSSMKMTLTGSGGNVTVKNANDAGTAKNITLSGVLSGTGGLVKTGGGTLLLSGANTYSGDTTVSAGILTVDGGLTFILGADGINNTLTNSGGTVNLDGSITIDTAAAATLGDWQILSGAINYGAGFTVSGWNWDNGDIWESADGIFTFDKSLGLVSAIPEPSTWTLLLTGAALMAMLRRRR
ncbi:MAG: autotransporter-associated beta strand repeat-containing protein [Verrucomicrobiales bacterium]|nr:autotransporter-associated beta strand repeat-containing protein [Verrucomicrobiales bacterium]